jgi:DNA/RNA endonuclease YhcR with UshA esterase domain
MRTILATFALVVGMSAAMAEEPAVIDAADLETLRAKVDMPVVVEGLVSDIGTTKDGGITFINIGMAKKQGFVAVIFRDSYQAFPDGFDKFKDKKVRVSGTLTLFRSETPQVKLKSPDQITIVTE